MINKKTGTWIIADFACKTNIIYHWTLLFGTKYEYKQLIASWLFLDDWPTERLHGWFSFRKKENLGAPLDTVTYFMISVLFRLLFILCWCWDSGNPEDFGLVAASLIPAMVRLLWGFRHFRDLSIVPVWPQVVSLQLQLALLAWCSLIILLLLCQWYVSRWYAPIAGDVNAWKFLSSARGCFHSAFYAAGVWSKTWSCHGPC